jgi:hypothetical protein
LRLAVDSQHPASNCHRDGSRRHGELFRQHKHAFQFLTRFHEIAAGYEEDAASAHISALAEDFGRCLRKLHTYQNLQGQARHLASLWSAYRHGSFFNRKYDSAVAKRGNHTTDTFMAFLCDAYLWQTAAGLERA